MVNELITAKEATTLIQDLGDISDFGVNGAQPISGLVLLFLGQSAVGQPAKWGNRPLQAKTAVWGLILKTYPVHTS